jgi:hypothetical protein
VLLEAVNLTFRTLERRTRVYRNLAVCVSLTILGSLLIAWVFRSWLVLIGLLAPPVYVGRFLYVDARTIRAWRVQVLSLRADRGLDMAQFQQTLRSLHCVPEATLNSMLATLNLENPKA